ncbi:beta-ketoacyl synthase N-terminal-like domain-containing protein [Geminocystis sp. GBBB08]|uniref:type I polyketide synthase n=1 Tax=Geminocystis sp. GBBB08 TaxID=2604140 RepID=UPI0027E2D731|nr:beta-ketoacyl synthase N-terminal-like domain-containing protein [Geminocystis sp. GBBB08]MBL1210975.1 hypothetical protein [Geminocystis sp. GBBB08]
MNQEPIAIIGISLNFPQADHLETFWHILKNRVNVITKYHRHGDNCNSAMVGGFLEEVDSFDADFFNISKEEACLMNPTHRLLLQSAWLALEDAQIIPKDIAQSDTGVFIAMGYNDYSSQIENFGINSFLTISGNNPSMTASRISSYFDFKGTSIAIDTACSSSLVAIDNASRSLWTKQSSLALVGGANLILSDHNFTAFQEAGMIAMDGCCKVFDAKADGYVQSEGVAMMVLKPLSEALKDGDLIYGTIIGSEVNHNGQSNTLTSPNIKAQIALLEKVYNDDKIDPHSIKYIETHAVGTPIGDALELKAIGKILGKNRPKDNPCVVGSVKTNLGHTESVSGMAGLIKILLCLQHRQLVPNLHFKQPNPSVAFKELNLKVQDKLEDLYNENLPLRMAVNAFGFGGTNAHIVVEEAPQKVVKSAEFPVNIFTISAKSESSLMALAKKYLNFLKDNLTISLTNLCYSANARRSQFDYRLFTVIESVNQLSSYLQKFIENQTFDKIFTRQASKSKQKIEALSFISETENIEDLSNELLTKKLFNLGNLWLEKGTINWNNFYAKVNPQYISIPTYAFERKRYWFTDYSPNIKAKNNELNNINNEPLNKISDQNNYTLKEIEVKLKEIWGLLLNKKNIDIEDNFFQLGGKSLQTVNLSSEIKDILDIDISPTLIFQYPTLKDLAQVIKENKIVNHSSLTTFNSIKGKNTVIMINSLKLTHTLNNDNRLKDYFFANLHIFKLSKENKENICKLSPEKIIEGIAKRIVEDISKANLKQPYQLIGVCGDAFLTMEIAHQLNTINHQIDSIILIDGIFKSYKPLLKDRYEIFRVLGLKYVYLRARKKIKKLIEYFKHTILKLFPKLFLKLIKEKYQKYTFYQSYLSARKEYNIKTYSGIINLLLSTEWKRADLSLINQITSDKLNIYHYYGAHGNFEIRSYVDSLIKTLIKINEDSDDKKSNI